MVAWEEEGVNLETRVIRDSLKLVGEKKREALLEIEENREQKRRLEELEKGLAEVRERYETTLEMLGEKTERVEELEEDLGDLR